MDSGEELAGAGGSHACSLPAVHASRSFSAGGATSASLTPLTLFSLAAPPLHLRELLLGPASHGSFPSSPEDALPASCLPAPHLRQAAPLLGTLAFHLSPVPHALTPQTHTPSLRPHTSGGSLTHRRVTRRPEHSPSPLPGEGSERPHCPGARRPRPCAG